jgi:hypothetical protein
MRIMSDSSSRWGRCIWSFAIPDDEGRWHVVPGEAEIIDGLYHKIRFPGFETHSGESFGISATFHVVDRIDREGTGFCARIHKIVLQNGRAVLTEIVGLRQPVVGVLNPVGDEVPEAAIPPCVF